ncbi:serine-rich adhesin for platelets [Galleria mellonella]|uniref:Serine-rich adhesin for platelets n=1 Tax=Galleria mellonella TaxID=7137 RepID=A0ABM3N723_GALME|nr:serine-rich adhesin for platelets [Galleria mellonella]
MELHTISHCLLFLFILLATEGSKDNNNVTEEFREPRSNRRVVKLYPRIKPELVACHKEGFQADPSDCTVFYRCLEAGRGKYTVFRFQCAPGTVYDPDTEICNHPQNTKRSQCGGKAILTTAPTFENEIDDIHQEVPSPISTKQPIYTERIKDDTISVLLTTKNFVPIKLSTTKYPSIVSTKHNNLYSHTTAASKIYTTKSQKILTNRRNSTKHYMEISTLYPHFSTKNHRPTLITQPPKLQNNQICNSTGFIGDSENCRKFYRCVNNLRGGFIKYEFLCSESTIWDDDIQACNHAWAVKRRRCGRGNSDKNFNDINYIFNTVTETVNSNISKFQPVKSTPVTPVISKAKKTIQKVDTNQSKHTTLSFLQNGYQDYATMKTKVTSISTSQECTKTGFIGDRNDCTKFYRCIDNGKGSYSKHEFSCGEGTVWDPKIEGCNHAWAVEECGSKVSLENMSTENNVNYTTIFENTKSTLKESTTTERTTKFSQTSISPTELITNEVENIGYGSQHLYPSSSETNNFTYFTSTSTTTNNNIGNNCIASGFIGDENDCKKFYRCVDNGQGGYIRYEFSCGQGTVWDSKIEACNHGWAVEKCGGSDINNINKVETTTAMDSITSISHIHSTSPNQHNTDYYDVGYESQNNKPISSTSITTIITSEQPTTNGNECSSNGFMSDKNDCKKFYRCVDDGNGNYIRYDFTCGEGTVWDSNIEACNHAWAVESCGKTENIPHTTAKPKPLNEEEINNSYPIYNDNISDKTTENIQYTTTRKPIKSNNDTCSKEGFFGDSNDCKKFYRCVDNNNGGYIKYEFTCGEGTVWDPAINNCNHKSSCKIDITTENLETSSEKIVTESIEMQNDLNSPQLETTTTTTIKPNSPNVCSQEGFIGDENNCKIFYRCVDNGSGGYIKYEFTCGDGTIWDSKIQACNHDSQNSGCNTNGNDSSIFNNNEVNIENNIINSTSTENIMTESMQQGYPSETITNICKAEGFYSNSNNCKMFYRCVNDGKGGYNKYDFSCGEGTMWDQKIQSCNHELSNYTCSNKDVAESTQSNKPSTESNYNTDTTSRPFEHSQSTENIELDSSPGNQNDQCMSEGFFGDSTNCKKFYRCVDNGRGGYTKYEFSCAEGTVWVQDIQACDHDEDSENCISSNKQTTTTKQTTYVDGIQQLTTTEKSNSAYKPDKQDDEYSYNDSNGSLSDSGNCSSEGFYSNKNDCKYFYRCVDNGNGGYIRYDFKCGEGTAWDSDLQTCNHIQEVKSCKNSNQGPSQDKPMMDEDSSQTTENTNYNNTTESSKPSNKDKCETDGYFGDSQDCSKFYRCVENEKGGYTKYDYTCGEGTVWDQDILTCNHPQDVTNPSCKEKENNTSTTDSSNSMSSSTLSSQSTSTSTSESPQQNNSNCTQESSTKSPINQNITCEKAGYYANPNDCKKFYRCVDWDGDGKRFSVYHFDCGDGTIWDPQLETCNYEESVYPPRICNGLQSQSENSGESTTQKEVTTTNVEESTQVFTTDHTTELSTSSEEMTSDSSISSSEQTTLQSTTTEKITTQKSTTVDVTTQESTTTDQTTSKQSTTTEQETTEQTTTEKTTTQQSTTDQTTSQQLTTTEQTTTQQSTTTDQMTSQQTTTTEYTTTQETTISEQTTSTNEGTTDQSTTSEQTTTELTTIQESTSQQIMNTEDTTTQQSSTTESTTTDNAVSTEQTTFEQQSTTTEQTDSSTNESSTTEETSSSPNKCPETDDDQYLYVCPTSFKRHPKYCNMFYQCTEDDDTHELKIAVFTCPNNTIYDENQIQCIEENKTDDKCDGEIAQQRRIKRLNFYYKEPIIASRGKLSCPNIGYYSFEKNIECSPAFLKCQIMKTGKLRGYVHQCPEGYYYWTISKRCEKKANLKDCKSSSNDWNNRWEIPYERRNIAI